ncbi:MAG TPA: 50S ribosomal protein L22 [Candidatus Nanoarchaeia archaeon]|nr:50S ribosomal protein L22 [Candidatus Nanoarchaeia archaeon]
MATNPHQAIVNGRNLSISLKTSVEVARFIRGKSIDEARKLLQQVAKKKIAVPYLRYKLDIGHRPGKMGPGRYPVKVSKEFITLLDSLEANAQVKGLNTSSLVIKRAIPNYAPIPYKGGRFRGRKTRRSHIQLVAEEMEKKVQKPKEVAKK